MITTAIGLRRAVLRAFLAAAAACLALGGAGPARADTLDEWLNAPAEHLDELRARLPELMKNAKTAPDPASKTNWTVSAGRVQAALGDFDAALKTLSACAKAAPADDARVRSWAYRSWFQVARRTGKPSAVKEACNAILAAYKNTADPQGKNLVSNVENQMEYLDRIGQSMRDLGGKTIQGPSFRLSEKKGKMVFVHFWGTW